MSVSDEMYICEKSEGIINCLNGQNLDIVYAYYGRSDLDVCPHDPVTSTTNTDCNSTEDILSIVKKKCQSQSNRMTCAITPTNDLFKGDPCYGTFKYLTVGYICSKPGWYIS